MLLPVCAIGQNTNGVTVNEDTATTRRFVPTGLRVGTDLIALFRSNFSGNFSGYELTADVGLNRYYPTFEYGSWSRDFEKVDTIYSNSGNYFRVGADVNFLRKDPEGNMFFLGLRYGRATFSEYMDVVVGDSLWGVERRQYRNANVKGRWFELTGGIKVKIWKMVWMGYTARFKFALNTSGEGEMLAHDVPGYGRTDKTSAWGFTYYLFIKIPFTKQSQSSGSRLFK